MEESRELEQETEELKSSEEEKTEDIPDTDPADDMEETSGTEPEKAEASGETSDSESGEPAEKKSFFKKKEKKEKKDKKDELIAELTDKIRRQLAEFENYRNRTEKEKSQMYAVGARDVIEKILPVVDNFERGIKSIPEEEKESPVASGMEMIYKQLMTVLTDLGVTPIEAVGQEFDPNLHNAVMHVDDEELGENRIVEEFQKGFQYKDAVLRYSMVKVAN